MTTTYGIVVGLEDTKSGIETNCSVAKQQGKAVWTHLNTLQEVKNGSTKWKTEVTASGAKK